MFLIFLWNVNDTNWNCDGLSRRDGDSINFHTRDVTQSLSGNVKNMENFFFSGCGIGSRYYADLLD